METSERRPRRELPIIGGHLALDFANTIDDPLGPARHDHAARYEDLAGWAVRVDAIPVARARRLMRAGAKRPAEAAATIASAHQLRAAVNDTFGAIADAAPDVSRHWFNLRPFVTAALAAATLDMTEQNNPHWSWPDTGDLAAVLHQIAAATAELLTSNQLSRVKRCARCPWLFLDNSKNRSRRWCDMNDCGRAQKVERYVARRARARQRLAGPDASQ